MRKDNYDQTYIIIREKQGSSLIVAVRALSSRLAKLERARLPKPSPFTIYFGSLDAFVDTVVIPGIQSETLSKNDMIDIVAAFRSWEENGVYDV